MFLKDIYDGVDQKMLHFLFNSIFQKDEEGNVVKKGIPDSNIATKEDILNLINQLIEVNKRIDLLFLLAGGEQTPAMQNKMDLGRYDTAYKL